MTHCPQLSASFRVLSIVAAVLVTLAQVTGINYVATSSVDLQSQVARSK